MSPKIVLEKSTSKEKAGIEYWSIFSDGKRAGKVFIELVADKSLGAASNAKSDGKVAKIQIFLNKQSQGKGIGSAAYGKACELSRHKVIYANMRKTNTASIKAACNAGFVERVIPGDRQVTMVWKR